MPCPICESISRIRAGQHARFLAELSETFAVLGDNQGTKGWCVLLLKEHVEHLAELPLARQARVFEDVARVAAAQRRVFGPVRINYECLGNQVAHVHWHVIPRHADDPDPRNPVWGWSKDALEGHLQQDEEARLIRDLVIALATPSLTFPAGDRSLLKQFFEEECSSHVRKVLLEAIEEQRRSGIPTVQQDFRFNRFDVTLHFATREVIVADDLMMGPETEFKLALLDFEQMLLTPVR